MKGVRIGVWGVFALALLGGMLTGARLCFFAAFLAGGLLLAALGLNVFTAACFTYLQTLEKPEAVQGETVRLHLEIHNDMPYPFPMMRVAVRAVAERENGTLTFSLAPHERAVFDLPLACAWRGEFGVGMTMVEIQDIFGLFRLPFPILHMPYYRLRPLLILPRAEALPLSPGGARQMGRHAGAARPVPGGEGDFCGVRDYRPGDRESRIHWKLAAARGQLYVRAAERPAQPRCLLLLDGALGTLDGEERLEAVTELCRCAATLARRMLEEGYPVRLAAPAPAQPLMAQAPSDWERVARWMALLPFSVSFDERAEAEVRALGQESLVALLTLGPLDEAAQRALRRSAEGGNETLCIRVCRREERLAPPPAGVADRRVTPGMDAAALREALT